MPSDAQLLEMIRSVTEGTAAEGIFSLDGLVGEERVVGRQFLELAYLICTRIPAGLKRVQALNQLRQARNAALDAMRP